MVSRCMQQEKSVGTPQDQRDEPAGDGIICQFFTTVRKQDIEIYYTINYSQNSPKPTICGSVDNCVTSISMTLMHF